jgi:hypothetical protein
MRPGLLALRAATSGNCASIQPSGKSAFSAGREMGCMGSRATAARGAGYSKTRCFFSRRLPAAALPQAFPLRSLVAPEEARTMIGGHFAGRVGRLA